MGHVDLRIVPVVLVAFAAGSKAVAQPVGRRAVTPFVGVAFGPGLVIRGGSSPRHPEGTYPDGLYVNDGDALGGGDIAVTLGVRFRSSADLRLDAAYWVGGAERHLGNVFVGPAWRVGPRRAVAVSVAIGLVTLPVDVVLRYRPEDHGTIPQFTHSGSTNKTKAGARLAAGYEWSVWRRAAIQLQASWVAAFPVVGSVDVEGIETTVGQVAYHHVALRGGVVLFLGAGAGHPGPR